MAKDRALIISKRVKIFPNLLVLDGGYVAISVRSVYGNATIKDSLLESTLDNGIIPSTKGDIETPIHHLAKIAFDTLGIESSTYEERNNCQGV